MAVTLFFLVAYLVFFGLFAFGHQPDRAMVGHFLLGVALSIGFGAAVDWLRRIRRMRRPRPAKRVRLEAVKEASDMPVISIAAQSKILVPEPRRKRRSR